LRRESERDYVPAIALIAFQGSLRAVANGGAPEMQEHGYTNRGHQPKLARRKRIQKRALFGLAMGQGI
jgi:hypothetical protein